MPACVENPGVRPHFSEAASSKFQLHPPFITLHCIAQDQEMVCIDTSRVLEEEEARLASLRLRLMSPL